MEMFFVFLIFVSMCHGAKILSVYNHPGGSHTFLGKVLLQTLAQKGHEVVMISSFPLKEKVPNYRDIGLPENLEDLKKRSMMYFNKNKGNELEEIRNMSLQHTENTFRNADVQKLLQSKETFDVIIIDWFFNEASLIFGHIYKAPVIYMSSFGNMALLSDFTGNTLPFSYVPGAGMIMSDDMSFKHRIIMTALNILFNFVYVPRRNKAHHEILKKYFDDPPTIEELQENVALVLSNSHFSFETPRPYTPNIIPIGGFHVQELKGLPQDLKNLLDGADEGVIYFSLGSQIKSSNLNKNLFSNIIEALGKVPQKVLWKYEDNDLTNLPTNIHILKWSPQRDILAHPNLKLFITHGGLLSVIEAVHFHVPILCLPFNGDQNTNAAFIESRGIGLKIIPENLTPHTFYNTIQGILRNPKYQKEINYRSLLLREQPVKPIDAAIFWVEHVIKHRHGNHLKTFATKLPWYKYYMIDVIGLCVFVVFVLYKILFFVLKKLLKFVCKRFFRSDKVKTA